MASDTAVVSGSVFRQSVEHNRNYLKYRNYNSFEIQYFQPD